MPKKKQAVSTHDKKILPKNYRRWDNRILNIDALPLEEFYQYKLIDVREPWEIEQNPLAFSKCENFPFSKFDPGKNKINKDTKYLFFCAKGKRSQAFVTKLRQKGFSNVFSLVGGIDELNAYLKGNLKNA